MVTIGKIRIHIDGPCLYIIGNQEPVQHRSVIDTLGIGQIAAAAGGNLLVIVGIHHRNPLRQHGFVKGLDPGRNLLLRREDTQRIPQHMVIVAAHNHIVALAVLLLQNLTQQLQLCLPDDAALVIGRHMGVNQNQFLAPVHRQPLDRKAPVQVEKFGGKALVYRVTAALSSIHGIAAQRQQSGVDNAVGLIDRVKEIGRVEIAGIDGAFVGKGLRQPLALIHLIAAGGFLVHLLQQQEIGVQAL